MFNAGQLVQSIKYGDYYVVVKQGPIHTLAKPLSTKKWPYQTMFIEHNRFRLIGNNYQSKPNNPAR